MNYAIMCNGTGNKKSDRAELIEAIRATGGNVFMFGIGGTQISPWYNEKTTAKYVTIKASRDNINPIKELFSIISVKKKIKENKIDTAVIYGVKNHAAMTIGAKLGGCKRIVCVVNGSGNLFKLRGMKGKLVQLIAFPMLRLAYNLSNNVCLQNSDDKDLLVRKRIIKDDDKVFLTGGSGVNLEIFYQQKMVEEDRFLFLARITPTKGIKEYIQAARMIKSKYPDAVFDIVGPIDGTMENADDLGIEAAVNDGIVVYHGATTDVPGWLGKCRYFIYPSYYPEGVPRCAMQAIASGRPIITCDTPGCKETVCDGVNGFIVPPKDPEALATKMIWMLENPEDIIHMARASRKLAEEKFDVKKINEEILKHL